jgi:hypothetical protein
MTLKSDAHKVNLYTKSAYGGKLLSGSPIYFNSKITVGGIEYFRTAHDTNQGNTYAVPARLLK